MYFQRTALALGLDPDPLVVLDLAVHPVLLFKNVTFAVVWGKSLKTKTKFRLVHREGAVDVGPFAHGPYFRALALGRLVRPCNVILNAVIYKIE